MLGEVPTPHLHLVMHIHVGARMSQQDLCNNCVALAGCVNKGSPTALKSKLWNLRIRMLARNMLTIQFYLSLKIHINISAKKQRPYNLSMPIVGCRYQGWEVALEISAKFGMWHLSNKIVCLAFKCLYLIDHIYIDLWTLHKKCNNVYESFCGRSHQRSFARLNRETDRVTAYEKLHELFAING